MSQKWDPSALKHHYAPSSVEVLTLLYETQEAFFQLPLPPKADTLETLVKGMEKALMYYAKKAADVGEEKLGRGRRRMRRWWRWGVGRGQGLQVNSISGGLLK